MAEEKKKLVEIKGLDITFNKGRSNETKAVQNATFDIYEGETFGLVGESGSGKTTIGRTIMKLYEPSAGEVLFDGKDIAKLKKRGELSDFRQAVQMIFQDPQASLNLRMKVKDIVAEGIDVNHLAASDEDRSKRVEDLLETVGLNRDHSNRYPHEFSADSVNVLVSPVRWLCNQSSSLPTSQSLPWMFQSKRKLLT